MKLEPTNHLRWDKRTVNGEPYMGIATEKEVHVLQQLWTSESEEEWRDIPVK